MIKIGYGWNEDAPDNEGETDWLTGRPLIQKSPSIPNILVNDSGTSRAEGNKSELK